MTPEMQAESCSLVIVAIEEMRRKAATLPQFHPPTKAARAYNRHLAARILNVAKEAEVALEEGAPILEVWRPIMRHSAAIVLEIAKLLEEEACRRPLNLTTLADTLNLPDDPEEE